MIAWSNPSYFWTGSAIVKQAEADVRRYGTRREDQPATSPARWFRWSTQRGTKGWTKPPDDRPGEGSGYVQTWGWVWDDDANASYLSTWGASPSTDLASPEWRAELQPLLPEY